MTNVRDDMALVMPHDFIATGGQRLPAQARPGRRHPLDRRLEVRLSDVRPWPDGRRIGFVNFNERQSAAIAPGEGRERRDLVKHAARVGESMHCSFCGKSRGNVEALVAGPEVFICGECIERCMIILLERRTGTPKLAEKLRRADKHIVDVGITADDLDKPWELAYSITYRCDLQTEVWPTANEIQQAVDAVVKVRPLIVRANFAKRGDPDYYLYVKD